MSSTLAALPREKAMEEQILRSQAHAMLETLTEDQIRLVLDFCLDLREALPPVPDKGLEALLEEPA
jgi:hypothetical protein